MSAAQSAAMAAATAAFARVQGGVNYACGAQALACQSAETDCPSTIGLPAADGVAVGCLYAQQSGFTTGGAGGRQRVTATAGVSNNAPTVPGLRTRYWVTYTVSESVPQLFSAVLGNPMGQIAARATAAITGTPMDTCVYVLDASASNAFVASGSAQVNTDCVIKVGSSNSKAMVVSGGACVGASSIQVGGGVVGTCMSPTPVSGGLLADPLASVPDPTFSGCDHVGFKYTAAGPALDPGVYCGGITVSGSGVSASLNPGIYVLNGGGLVVSGGASISGAGVMFYNTASGSYSYKPIAISGGSATSLSAPTTGVYSGILIFQDRAVGTGYQETISGGSAASFTGAVYVPRSKLVYSGGSSTANGEIVLISRLLEFSGSSYLKKYTGTVGQYGTAISLIE